MSKNISHFSSGGQVWAHKVRMLGQVLKISTKMSLVLSLGYFLIKALKMLSFKGIYFSCIAWWAACKLFVGSALNVKEIRISFYDDQWYTWPANYFLAHPYVNRIMGQTERGCDALFSSETLTSFLIIGFISYIAVFAYFYVQGKNVGATTHKRGLSLVSLKALIKEMKKRDLVGDFHLDGVPLVKGAETSHMLIAGTTGSGKTNTFHHLLPQIRAKGQKAIIVDVTGDLTAKYFDAERDIILSPGHSETAHWNPWLDATDIYAYQGMADAFIGASTSNDPFWTEAAKACLAASFEKLSGQQDLKELIRILLKSDLQEFSSFLQGTAAAAFADSKGERTTVSIRATLASKIRSLDVMADTTGDFSIKEWMNNGEAGWLFLSTPPSKRQLLCPLMTAQIAVAVQSLMDMGAKQDRRLWFVLDELPALNKISSLQTLLTEGRKYGACTIVGVQDMPQLETRYGTKETKTLLNQLNTKVLFRFTDPHGSQFASRILGEKEETEVKENLSYGANTIRDGVSMNEITKKENVIMPTEIAALKNLECYIKLPENLPLLKHHMRWAGD